MALNGSTERLDLSLEPKGLKDQIFSQIREANIGRRNTTFNFHSHLFTTLGEKKKS